MEHKQITSPLWLGSNPPPSDVTVIEHVEAAGEQVEQNGRCHAIVLSLSSSDQDHALQYLRAHESTTFVPILVTRHSELSPYLANGLWGDGFSEQMESFRERWSRVKLDGFESPEHRLLVYLWLHDVRAFSPRPVPASRHLYEVPLLKAWRVAAEDTLEMLDDLRKDEVLQSVRILNRIRKCGACDSGHLNYIDSCPACSSIDIEHQSSLHCFNCGHVADADAFRLVDRLRCPNCAAQLRHIGVDYDRPIENQSCNSCEKIFVDAHVDASCFHCGEVNALDELQVRQIHEISLTRSGRVLAMDGIRGAAIRIQQGEEVSPSHFKWLVSWMNQLGRRHEQNHLVLLIEFPGLNDYVDKVGDEQGLARLDYIRQVLRSGLRETDAVATFGDNEMMALFPMTSLSAREEITGRFDALIELRSESEFQCILKAVQLPGDPTNEIDEWLRDQFDRAEAL